MNKLQQNPSVPWCVMMIGWGILKKYALPVSIGLLIAWTIGVPF